MTLRPREKVSYSSTYHKSNKHRPHKYKEERERERDGSISHKLYFEDKPKAKKYYHVV